MQKIISSQSLNSDLTTAISECEHDRIFILTDEKTAVACLPVIQCYRSLRNARSITVKQGDTHKDIEALADIWQFLSQNGATRHSLLINLGGGMITDLGGFAAATFKRGIDFINIPTTLLAMVDASVGGKTGINFCGLKNEIGAFCDARYVLLNTAFLKTLDQENLRSGYAEMLKHGLISVAVKRDIVEQDPHEHGIRKALNLGHTIGHAFESFAMKKGSPILHGYAVAYGIVCELYLSAVKTAFPTEKMRQTVAFIRENYGQMDITCDDYPELLALMRHDKKNTAGTINFTLLADIGDIRINQTATEEEIKEALDFYREG